MNDATWLKCQDGSYLNLANLDSVKIVGSTTEWKAQAIRMVGFDWDPSEETNKPFSTSYTLFAVKFDKGDAKMKEDRRRLTYAAVDNLLSPGVSGCYSAKRAVEKASLHTKVDYPLEEFK